MKHYQSTLASISDKVFAAKSVQEAKTIITEHLSGTRVKDAEKMITEVARMSSLTKIWYYFSNALLKFEQLSLSQLNPKKD